MKLLAPIAVVQDFTATNTAAPFNPFLTDAGAVYRLPPCKFWALQVTGLTAADVIALPTAWDVIIQPSINGISFNDMSTPVLEHVNGTNSNGDIVWSGAASAPARLFQFFKIHVKTLTLGATATKIRVFVIGE